MEETRRILGPQKLMVANILRARFPDSGMSSLRAFDGSYMEGFESPVGGVALKDYVVKGIAGFQKAAREGYLIAFTAGLGGEEIDENDAGEEARNPQLTDELRKPMAGEDRIGQRLNYLLATFLICTEKHSYFNAHDGYDAEKSRLWMKHPPEFSRPLGAQRPCRTEGHLLRA